MCPPGLVCFRFGFTQVVRVTPFEETTMKKIFGTLLDWVVTRPGWPAWARPMTAPLVASTLRLFDTITAQLRPTPEKSHYTFNLRDVSKVPLRRLFLCLTWFSFPAFV